MSVNVTKLEDNKVRMDVEVAPEQVQKGVEAKVRELARKIRVPGFRPGKAPRRVIESHLGRDYIFMEALQDSLPNWYSDAVLKSRLRPIDRPEISFDSPPEEGKSFKFSATVEVRPEARLGEYKGVEVPRRKVEVSDEDVDRQLEEFRNQFATLAAVEDRPVREGDFVILDFKGERMAGGPVEGAEAEDYMLEVGRGEFLEEFEKNLVGMNAGERKQFGVTFPMDYRDESLRGQSVLFRVHVKEIKERDLPPLDDEFAMEASEFDTLEEFRGAIREQLEEAARRQAEGEFRARVLDVVAANAEVEVPEVMVEDRVREMVESFERNVQAQGIKPEQYYQIAQTTREEVARQARPDAEDVVRKELVLDAVVRAEDIRVEESEVVHEIEHLAEDSGRDVNELVESMKKNGTFQLLEEEIARRKALDFLAENAIPTELEEEEAEEAEAEAAESGEEQER
ncbi:trigger factor [Rubrobacter taiwanensis]|uniref:Trigger factor n=1 Tax=Rubrobacter taiwanensis TaxID=185139 RepID=A0A4V2NWG5_9ACTN|nr:trigger factor [Rubrobacter taiwanensis]TCJ17342.1 trigger factor [Rubrobacter taiwanensis]